MKTSSALGASLSALVLAMSSLAARDVVAAPPVAAAPAADVEVVSLGVSHTELAPDTALLVTVAVRSNQSAAGPLSVGLYYAEGRPAGRGVPRSATLLRTIPIRRLAKGEVATYTDRVRLPPCDRCGPHGVYAVLNTAGAVADGRPENDVRAVELDVSEDHLPDLRTEGVEITPDRGSTQSTVTVRGKVKNRSRFYAEGPFRVSVYCSPYSEPSGKDRRLYSFMVPNLAAGDSIGVDRAVTLVPECGVYAASTWIGIVADDQNTVREENEQNDGKSLPFWVFRAPDLTSQPVAIDHAAGPVGTRVALAYRIANHGGSAASQFRTGVYLAPAGKGLRDGTLLDAVTVPSLAANTDSGIMQHVVTIPKVPRGRYSLGVYVDLDGQNGELHRRNNFEADPFQVTEVNLTDVHFTVREREAAPSGTVELGLAVHDTGRDGAPASRVGIYYSDDPRFDPGLDRKLADVDVEALRAGGASREKTVTVTLPADAREGYRFLLAVVDEDDAVTETDEHDNVALEPIRIVLPDGASASN
ncbi:MAG TPA: CARDB domain-containing protein [Polyangiaceae bacterium]|nr:CARDB domain-containing protein [Polyangiaceae bacterium]